MITTKDFISKIKDIAIEEYIKYGILPSITIAQGIIESASGNKDIGGNNLFGMKWYENCGYDYVYGNTKEYINGQWISVKAKFKKYDSWNDSIHDHTQLLLKDRYKPVRQAKDFWYATQALKDCGYATSPNYPDTLRRVILNYNLYTYDYKLCVDNAALNFAWREFYSTVNFNGKDYKRIVEPYPEYLTNMLNVASQLQKLREYFNKPVIITSGFRTPYFNALIKGANNSQHLYGNAADIRIAGVTTREILDVAREITNFKGYGLSSYFLHCDLRDKPALWYY
jgi:hypothetical protein